jgi:hypothetical protein
LADLNFAPVISMPAMTPAGTPLIQLKSALQDIDNIIYSIELTTRAGSWRKEDYLRRAWISLAILQPARGSKHPKGAKTVSFEFRRIALKEHKFEIGQTVYFTSRPIGHMAANSTYQVVKLLPSDGADYQYRIKSANEAFERVARESQLER